LRFREAPLEHDGRDRARLLRGSLGYPLGHDRSSQRAARCDAGTPNR
jgi:hypothetical protein